MSPAHITPLILTWNEAPNIERCLRGLAWAGRVVVIDSGSTDETLAICSRFPQVEVITRSFDNHTAQWNHGVDAVATPWVLALDADYEVPEAFVDEISELAEDGSTSAWFANFRYRINGRDLRRCLYPPRAVLFDKSRCRYVEDGHTQLLRTEGATGTLNTPLVHDDRKPLSRWLDSQRKYAALEADKLLAGPARKWPDRIRQWIWPSVPLVFLYTLFVKGCLLDGWPGLHYTLQRTVAEAILAMELLGRRIPAAQSSAPADGSSAPAARRGGG